MRWLFPLVLLACCASAGEAPAIDTYVVQINEVFPQQGTWQGLLRIGSPLASRPGYYVITDFSAVVGHCSRESDCKYEKHKVTGAFNPKLNQIDAAETGQPNAVFISVDAQGKELGSLSFKGKEWSAYNVRGPGAARNGTISALPVKLAP